MQLIISFDKKGRLSQGKPCTKNLKKNQITKNNFLHIFFPLIVSDKYCHFQLAALDFKLYSHFANFIDYFIVFTKGIVDFIINKLTKGVTL